MAFVIDSASTSWSFEEGALQALLQGPVIMGLWHNGLDIMRDKANEIAQTEDAEYGSAVHDEGNEWGFEPGGYIYTKNYKARVDDHYHNTLLTIAAMAPSLIEAAGVMDLGDGTKYDPRGRGSTVRGPDGRFTTSDGVKRGTRAYDALDGEQI